MNSCWYELAHVALEFAENRKMLSMGRCEKLAFTNATKQSRNQQELTSKGVMQTLTLPLDSLQDSFAPEFLLV